MNCNSVRSEFWLYLYDELSADQEHLLTEHLEGCADCRRELEREQALHRALDIRTQEPPPALLAQCRRGLRSALRESGSARWGWLGRLAEAITSRESWLLRPAGAVALVAIGFFSARLTPTPFGDGAFSPTDLVSSRVRFVEPSASGRVRIVVEETRRRLVSGTMAEEPVRSLLLAASRDPEDAGLRLDSMGLLQQESASAVVRRALLEALQRDSNAGVRLKALEALRPFVRYDAEVRRGLGQVLLRDDNPGLRAQAIDMLVEHNSKDVVGVLQDLMRREGNDYIRQRGQRALREMNASVETF